MYSRKKITHKILILVSLSFGNKEWKYLSPLVMRLYGWNKFTWVLSSLTFHSNQHLRCLLWLKLHFTIAHCGFLFPIHCIFYLFWFCSLLFAFCFPFPWCWWSIVVNEMRSQAVPEIAWLSVPNFQTLLRGDCLEITSCNKPCFLLCIICLFSHSRGRELHDIYAFQIFTLVNVTFTLVNVLMLEIIWKDVPTQAYWYLKSIVTVLKQKLYW